MPFLLKHIVAGKLEDVSLEVGDGEILALIGPEGEGVGEIFKVISGEIPLKRGRIILNGNVIRGKGIIGSVFEDYILYKRINRKGLYFFSYRRWLRRVDKEKLRIVSDTMGMDRGFLLSPSMHHLSKGERKKFDLARYLVTKREVILLDDPLIGIDQSSKEILKNFQKIIAQFNQPCLYRANSMLECRVLRCRVALIRKGKVEYCGEWKADLGF